ncbi:adhesion G protein-coupled receptor E3-like [Strongylocentrotus purpuratus]|uniref:G-protein coupled receptors family 2 profile 2 domain-containing protein n=1 Tax=Strongylocentrotus purpuratus TaxID=7668 RepID=A0A7M7NVE9_STRPU|nr:adhesion G protein-coupled receptor E3-like [Strongylocentrotus purpuratus]
MVSQCDVRWSNEEIKAKCEGQAVDEDPLTLMPIQYLTSITFKNVYCAVCNFKNISGITPWGIDATCLSEKYSNLSRSEFSAQQIGDIMGNCLIWNFESPFSPTAARQCQNPVIATCDVDPKNETMVLLAQACESYKGVISIYKNPHCFMCNKALVYNQTLESIYLNLIYMACPPFTTGSRVEQPSIPFPSYPISVLFDFSSVDGLSSQEPLIDLSCRDNQLFDTFNQLCINLTCPVGYDFINGTCQRLLANPHCSFKEAIPILIEVECMYNDGDMSNCHPDVRLHDYVISLINGNYISSRNLTISRFQAEIQGNDSFTKCTQNLDIWGYLGINIDVSQENLDSVFLSTNQQSSAVNDICSNMTFRIYIGCSSINESCPNRVLSTYEFMKSHDNVTGQVFFVGETKYSLLESLYVIEYDITSSGMNLKRESLEGCQVPSETCALVSQNISLFVDLGNGSYLYSPLNRTLSPNDYLDVGNDSIFVCSYVLVNEQSAAGFLRFTSAQSILSTIGISLSIIALIVTFVTYLQFNLLRKATSNTLIMSLCITLIFAQSLILFGGLATMNSNACLSFAILGHFMWIAVFSHTTVLAFDLHRRFGIATKFGLTDEGAAVLSRFLLFSWGCPIFVVVPSLGIYFSGTKLPHFNLTYKTVTCWIGDGMANLYVFGIPIASLLVVNLILFVMVVAGLHRMRMSPVNKHKSTDSNMSSDLLIYIKMSTLLGFTWVFGFVAAFANVTALWYIFILLNSLQGVYIFIAFICNKRVFKLWRDSCTCLDRVSSTSSSKSRATSSDVVTMKKSDWKTTTSESML